MNINSVSFKGTFCLNSKDLNHKKLGKISAKEDAYCISTVGENYLNPGKTYMCVPQKFDSKFKNLLNKLSLKYEEINEEEALTPKNIVNRMIMPENYFNRNKTLKYVNSEKLNTELKKDAANYVGSGGYNGIGDHYERFINFLRTNQSVIVPDLCVRKLPSGEIKTNIQDGRHRFAVLHDMGIQKIPFSIDKDSIEPAREIGLI